MDKEKVIKNLRILGIVDLEQFQKGDLRYWWQLKFKEIKKYYGKESRDLLIKTNTAFGELEKLDMKLILRCLSEKDEIQSETTYESEKDEIQSETTYEFENSKYYHEQKLNRNRIKLKEVLTVTGAASSFIWMIGIIITSYFYSRCDSYYYFYYEYCIANNTPWNWEELFVILIYITIIMFFLFLYLYDKS